jgi:hypothetical protein
MSNIHDKSFYQRMMLQKEEQIRKIKNVSDLGMSKEQIIEYVIAPLKIEKSDMNEIKKLCDDENNKYTREFLEKNWWAQRTNAPYKNILKDENWKKEIKSGKDLIVHKVTDLDRVGLQEDYIKLQKLLETHNGELKVIFSASKESEYKKSFKFVQKYKYRMKYDPKDYNDLKNYYKKEQKRYDKDQKKYDEIIGRIMDDDKIDDKELKQIESEFLKPSKSKKIKRIKDTVDNMESQIQEMIEMYGEDDIEKILQELDADSEDEKKIVKEKEREKEKDKDREKDRNKEREREREKEREREREKDRKREKMKDNVRDKERDKEREGEKERDKEREKKKKCESLRETQNDTRRIPGISIKREKIMEPDDMKKDPGNKFIKGIRIGTKTTLSA